MSLIQEVKDGQIVDNKKDTTSKKTSGSDLGEDQFLQLLVAQMQYQDPLEPTSNTEWVAQMATFSMVESVNNMNTAMQEQAANSLVGKYVIINTTDSAGNATYIKGKVDYVTKQNGEVKLSVADGLYSLDELDTVADQEYYEGSVMANELEQMISLLPQIDNLTVGDEGLVKSARELYDKMTDTQKQFVEQSSLQKLIELETRMNALKATEFSGKVKALPSEEELTQASGETLAGYRKQLKEARAYYDNMTDAQKEKVDEGDVKTLEKLEEALDNMGKTSAGKTDSDTDADAETENGGAEESGSTDEVADILKKILEELQKE